MRKPTLLIVAASIIGTLAIWVPGAISAGSPNDASYEPHLRASDFSTRVTNRYFPLPVGWTWVYKGIKEGKPQIDRVTVTSVTKRVAEGITARAITDVAKTPSGKLLEKTTDWYAQDKRGNVWYFGEKTAAYLPGGKIDRSGSWEAGVKDGEPGIIMLASPQIPDAYRQEYQKGNAEDTAWIVNRGTSASVPFGTLHNILTSLEFARIEPKVVDQKLYAPRIGIIQETALTGPPEVAKLVRIIK
ncbi:MAG: hypothetical protein JO321_02375 [Solirubrobacterales bacterium]|nr:hypothetical protein [Solirubrobacterales bacterium]